MKIFFTALILILVILAIPLTIYGPVLKEEFKFNIDQTANVKYVIGTEQLGTFEKPLIPPNTDFSILIPKIGATAAISQNIDPTDPKQYLPALKKGLAQVKNSATPIDPGNMILFDHAADSFAGVNQYNAIFFLENKLIPGDEIDIYFQGILYKYTIFDKKIIEADSITYPNTLGLDINPDNSNHTLMLITGYPAGTVKKRLVTFAKMTQ